MKIIHAYTEPKSDAYFPAQVTISEEHGTLTLFARSRSGTRPETANVVMSREELEAMAVAIMNYLVETVR